jgi:uncharacterized protein
LNPERRNTFFLTGAAGRLECALDAPKQAPRAIALVAHPHPLYGGTMDNKVVQTLVYAFNDLGYAAYRMNFRGVGRSEGAHDNGMGETEDVLLLAEHARAQHADVPLFLAGFSFGCYVQTRVAQRLQAKQMVLVAPAVNRFEVAQVPANTLVIHGEVDDTVPLAAVLDWARPQNLPIALIAGADHFFHKRLQIIRGLVTTACRL